MNEVKFENKKIDFSTDLLSFFDASVDQADECLESLEGDLIREYVSFNYGDRNQVVFIQISLHQICSQ